jgi:hypothetical protein
MRRCEGPPHSLTRQSLENVLVIHHVETVIVEEETVLADREEENNCKQHEGRTDCCLR